MTTTDDTPAQKPTCGQSQHRFPVLNFLFSSVMFVVSLIWLVTGQIVLPNKGVFLYGTQARVAAALLFLFSIAPFIQKAVRFLRGR